MKKLLLCFYILSLQWKLGYLLCENIEETCGRRVKCRNIKSKNKMTNATKLSDGCFFSCFYNNTTEIPKSKEDEKTAPRPDSMVTYCYKYKKDENRAALNIIWKQKENHIMSHVVTGYFLRVQGVQYLFHFTFKPSNSGSNDSQKCIEFQFKEFGRSKQILKSGDNISAYLWAMPMPRWQNDPMQWKNEITVPSYKECKYKRCHRTISRKQDKTISESSSKITMKSHTTSVSRSKDDHFSNLGLVIIPPLGVIAFAFAILLFVLLTKQSCKKKVNFKPKIGKFQVLMISDDVVSNEDVKSCQRLSERLKQDLPLCTTCNWQNREKISTNLYHWYNREISKADAIIFLITNQTIAPNNFLELENDNKIGKENRVLYSDEFWKAKNMLLKSSKIAIVLKKLYRSSHHEQERMNPYKVFELKDSYEKGHGFYKYLTSLMEKRNDC